MFFSSLDSLLNQLEKDRKKNSLVFTNGCFDILHMGHVRYLKEAKSCGDLLLVAVNSDRSVRKLKGPERPLQKQRDRVELLAALACVDYSVLFDEDTPLSLIEKIRPDVLVKGGDWSKDQIVGYDFVTGYGGEVKALDFIGGYSTTELVERIKRG